MKLRMTVGRLVTLAPVAGLAVVLGAPALAAPADGNAVLTPHRAVYDLKLLKSRGTRGVEAVRGRIVYDFSGSACEGYGLEFRQVSELDSGEGKAVVSEMRSSTWEEGNARKFRFNSQNKLNDKRTDQVDGRAERNDKAVAVNLSKPKQKTLTVPGGAVFPTEHMRRILAAAREGKTILEFPVYDGSETGDKFYNTLTVIGREMAPDQKPATDAAKDVAALSSLKRWPVSITYFEQQDEKTARTGEQMPAYSIAFEIYENGISRALVLDYSDFTISGELSQLELKSAKPCP